MTTHPWVSGLSLAGIALLGGVAFTRRRSKDRSIVEGVQSAGEKRRYSAA